MIIFDLDGTLANCEHRRHFVDINAEIPVNPRGFNLELIDPSKLDKEGGVIKNKHLKKWKPDWDAFYEACSEDEPIEPVCQYLLFLAHRSHDSDVQIWSGRSESVYQKTFDWLKKHRVIGFSCLKMRPIGNTEPDEVLKGRWLDEAIAQGKVIEYVFDDRIKMIRFWRSKGIFCFNVNQTGEEF